MYTHVYIRGGAVILSQDMFFPHLSAAKWKLLFCDVSVAPPRHFDVFGTALAAHKVRYRKTSISGAQNCSFRLPQSCIHISCK